VSFGIIRIIELKPNHFPVGRDLSIDLSLGQKGDREGEIRAYHEAIRLQPNNALAYFNLGVALGEKGEINGEIAAYREVIRLQLNNPDYAEAHFKLALALGHRGDLDGATAAWRRGLHLNLQERSGHLSLSTSSHQKAILEKVMAAWRIAIRLEPGDVNYSQIHYRVGEALAQRGVWGEAIKVYQEIVRLKPDGKKAKHTLTKAHHHFGLSLFEKGKVDEAIEAFRLTLKLDPSYAPAKHDLQAALLLRKTTPN